MRLALHRSLAQLNRSRFSPSLPTDAWRDDLADEIALRMREGQFVEDERSSVVQRAAKAPTSSAAFVRWFESLEENGPGQHDELFDWLAESATLDEMRWFLKQEVAGEAGFEDLLALTQLKMPDRPKLEMAHNFWDELGCGHAVGMHGPMLQRLSDALQLEALDAPIVWESMALGNLMAALAANRRYAYQSVGALGVIELTAPGRAEKVNEGLRRLGVGAHERQYFALHAKLDLKHAAAWNKDVIAPLVAANHETAHAIAEGALLRLEAGARCFQRYREELGLTAPQLEVAAGP